MWAFGGLGFIARVRRRLVFFFFFNDTATTEIYTLSLPDALPISGVYHFRPFGRPQIEAYFGGRLAAELEAGGDDAFVDFAVGELVGLFGSDFARRVKPLKLHPWGIDPFSRGSYSYALPGKAECRAALAAAVDDRLFFAGEACSRSDYSTAHGAYLTGAAASEQVIAARIKR